MVTFTIALSRITFAFVSFQRLNKTQFLFSIKTFRDKFIFVLFFFECLSVNPKEDLIFQHGNEIILFFSISCPCSGCFLWLFLISSWSRQHDSLDFWLFSLWQEELSLQIVNSQSATWYEINWSLLLCLERFDKLNFFGSVPSSAISDFALCLLPLGEFS